MFAFLLQDYVTIRGQAAVGATITQPESGWLDLAGFQDIIVWLDAKEFSGGGGTGVVNITYQTSPSKDEAFFQPMITPFAVSTNVTVNAFLKDSAATPLARYLRWQLSVGGSPATAWDAQFRIWVAANAPGRGVRSLAPDTAKRVTAGTPSVPCAGCASIRPSFGAPTRFSGAGVTFTPK